MYKLVKLKELSGYRFFQNFKWDEESCKLFTRYNIIYGWNGTGKTTLCDFFRELESGDLLEKGSKMSMMFENTETKAHAIITRNKLNTIPYKFHVYHNRYIQDNITEVDKVQHIFALGTEQKELIEQLGIFKAKQVEEESKLVLLKKSLAVAEKNFDTMKTAKASEIKNTANFSGAYNKNKFYEAYKKLKDPFILDDDSFQCSLTDLRAEKKALIPIPKFSYMCPSIRDIIIPILRETPINVTIEALENDGKLNGWVEQGLSIHDDRNTMTCHFCGNRLSEKRKNALKSHFNKSYKELSNKIKNTIEMLRRKAEQNGIDANALPNKELFYSEFKIQVEQFSNEIRNLLLNNQKVMAEIITILLNKSSDMINLSYVSQFEGIIGKMSFDYSFFTKLVELIKAHNNKSADFQNGIIIAQRKLEKHIISICAPKILEMENSIFEKRKKVEVQDAIVKSIDEKTKELDMQVRNSQIPAEAINRDIEFIMGRKELVFENGPLGYQVTREGRIAKNLSNGEANAIALIYFFNSLSDERCNPHDSIIILDDPISSFDSNFYYNAISYIRDKTNDVGQVFVFTHKFSLLKDYSLMYKGETNRYMMQRINGVPALLNEDDMIGQFHDEYAFLFKQIYLMANSKSKTPSPEFLVYPNIARRLLEGFLTFKIPTNETLSNKVLKLEDGHDTAAGRSMLRLLNNHSHLRIILDNSTMDNTSSISQLQDILKNLLTFIERHDNLHYSTLVEQCCVYESNEEENETASSEKYSVDLYDLRASAGNGITMLDDIPSEKIDVTNPKCSFAVQICGDSMEPEMHDGSIVLVEEADEVPNYKIGVFLYNGEVYCKKRVNTDNSNMLVSLNKAYAPIQIQNDSAVTCGMVIEIL